MKVFQVMVPADLHKKIRKQALRHGVLIKEIVIEALEQYLEKQK